MDPQQRLLLEFGYIALHAVCGLRESLRAADVGVFMNADFATLHMQGKSVYAAKGGTKLRVLGWAHQHGTKLAANKHALASARQPLLHLRGGGPVNDSLGTAEV